MRKLLLGLALTIGALPAGAALPQGAQAPDFFTTGALAGKPFKLHLKEQLRKGPVVLYFFPKAFTKGCTLEAHAFSEANKEFRKAGARVIGMSADDLPRLEIHRDGELLIEGWLRQVFVDAKSWRKTEIPGWLRETLGVYAS